MSKFKTIDKKLLKYYAKLQQDNPIKPRLCHQPLADKNVR